MVANGFTKPFKQRQTRPIRQTTWPLRGSQWRSLRLEKVEDLGHMEDLFSIQGH